MFWCICVVIHDSDQKGISPFNQYFKPNCFNFIAFQIVSTEIGYTFSYINCNASSRFNSVFPLRCIPLIWRNEFGVVDHNRVSVIPKMLIFFWFIKCSKTSLLFQSPCKFCWFIEKLLSACLGPGLTSISLQARSKKKNSLSFSLSLTSFRNLTYGYYFKE